MANFCLTKIEVADLTHARVGRLQLEFLQRNGIKFYIDRYGKPVVPRSAVEPDARHDSHELAWRPRKARS